MTTRRYRTFLYDSGRWDGFALRPGDVVISTPAKCGTTWMQMICALLLLRTPDLPAPLAELSPWLDMQLRPIDDVRAALDAQPHRRFIKTHTPLDGLPHHADVTYLGVARDPRDVAMSWDNHFANMDLGRLVATRIDAVGADDLAELGITEMPPPPPEDPVDRFWQWMEGVGDEPSQLSELVHHVVDFWERRDEPNVQLFHYADLRADLAGEMARLATVLDVEPPTDELVAAATFDAMRDRADELAPNVDTPFWQDTRRFFDRARTGEWSSFLDEHGQQRYRKLVGALAPPDVVDWLHTGWRGA